MYGSRHWLTVYFVVTLLPFHLQAADLRVGLPNQIRNLDSQRAFDLASLVAISCIQEGLYELTRDGNPIPILAQDLPETRDQLTYYIKLKEQITFHDGTPFNAQAMAFTIDRLLKSTGVFPSRELFEAILSVAADSEYVLRIKTSLSPLALAKLLARPEMYALSPTTVKRYGDDYGLSSAVGTGPFRLLEWQRGVLLTLEKYEGFAVGQPQEPAIILDQSEGEREKTAILQARNLKAPQGLYRIEFKPYSDGSGMSKDLQKNRLGIAVNPAAREAVALQSAKYRSCSAPGRRLVQIYLNTAKSPFNDNQVRRALNLAVNRAALIEACYGGMASPAGGPIPLWHSDHDSSLPMLTYDPVAARSLLRDAGYETDEVAFNQPTAIPDLPTSRAENTDAEASGERPANKNLAFELLLTDTAEFRAIAENLQSQLARIGIIVKLRMLRKSEVFDRVYGRNGYSRGEFMAALEDYEDFRRAPDAFRYLADYLSTAESNKTLFSNSEFDRLASDYYGATQSFALKSKVQRLEQIIIELAPAVFLCNPQITNYFTYPNCYCSSDGLLKIGKEFRPE